MIEKFMSMDWIIRPIVKLLHVGKPCGRVSILGNKLP